MKPPNLPVTPKSQTMLKLTIAREVEIDGVQMGVMSDGTAYLTGRGLAAMCGVVHSVIQDLTNNWESEQTKPRGVVISNMLHDAGYDGPLFIPIDVDGSTHFAYPDVVCTAILEYYAFESKPAREVALKNFRLLARSSLKAFIYIQVGYDPQNQIPVSWKQFHDRVSLNYDSIPHGYFSVFKEIADMVVAMIQSNVPVDEKTVPDISVGINWGKHWEAAGHDQRFGKRVKYEHNYPDYFPQAKSNPQLPWAYPDSALGEFRRWMRDIYFTEKFPVYIANQCQKRALPPSIAQMAIEAVSRKQIPAKV